MGNGWGRRTGMAEAGSYGWRVGLGGEMWIRG